MFLVLSTPKAKVREANGEINNQSINGEINDHVT